MSPEKNKTDYYYYKKIERIREEESLGEKGAKMFVLAKEIEREGFPADEYFLEAAKYLEDSFDQDGGIITDLVTAADCYEKVGFLEESVTLLNQASSIYKKTGKDNEAAKIDRRLEKYIK